VGFSKFLVEEIMARASKSVFLTLDTLSFDEFWWEGNNGGQIIPPSPGPSFTPYIWTLFFVADGTTLSVNAGASLTGAAQVMPTTGTREDLGSPALYAGQSVRISSSLGFFSSKLQAIPVDPSLWAALGSHDLPGMFGAVAVVMAQDGYFTDSLARHGEDALNTYVTNAIASVIASIGPTHLTVSQSDIDSLTSGASEAVKSAIKNALGPLQAAAIFFNGSDYQIGHATWTFSQDDFPDESDTKDITKQVNGSNSRWSIHGNLSVSDQCAATATVASLNDTNSSIESGEAEKALASMRQFRDFGELRKVPTSAWWWDAVCSHSAEIAHLVRRDVAAREATNKVIFGIAQVLASPDRPIADAFLRDVVSALEHFRASGSPALARVARRSLWMAARVQGKTMYEAESVFAAGRRPEGR
jgi:hypothetical protein